MLTVIAQKLLNGHFAVDDAVTTPQAFRHSGCIETTHTVKWDVGVNAGEVTVEVAANEKEADAWAPVAVFTFDGSVTPAPKTEYVRVQGTYGAFRHRITGQVEDGSVTTQIEGAA